MTKTSLSRRALLRGDIHNASRVLFPPWSVADFTSKCQRCDDCIASCPESILVRGDGGFPAVDFSRGACTFCQDCVTACKHAALDRDLPQPWQLKASVTDQCLAINSVICRSCGDSCEQRAIQFRLQTGGRSMPVISQSLCNGCGACFSVCPTKAIQLEEAA
jgi:ferredoxin-type protein NapF